MPSLAEILRSLASQTVTPNGQPGPAYSSNVDPNLQMGGGPAVAPPPGSSGGGSYGGQIPMPSTPQPGQPPQAGPRPNQGNPRPGAGRTAQGFQPGSAAQRRWNRQNRGGQPPAPGAPPPPAPAPPQGPPSQSFTPNPNQGPIDWRNAQGLIGTPGGVISQAPQPGLPTQAPHPGNPMGWGGAPPPPIYGQPAGGYQGPPAGGLSPEQMAQIVAWLRANGGAAPGGGMGGIG